MPRTWVTRAITSIKAEEPTQSRLFSALGSLESLSAHLTYSCDTKKLRHGLDRHFFPLACNQHTFDFLTAHPAHSWFGGVMRSATGMFLSNTDANTLLGMYKMHVLDRANAQLFLDGTPPPPSGTPALSRDEQPPASRTPASRGKLLDVGAGDGHVTAEIMGLFDSVLATEVSRPALWRMRMQGVPCEKMASLEPLKGQVFDTVACLNVLDRCSHPKSLLRDLRGLVKPQTGRLLLAVVFPFRPCVELGWGSALGEPEEWLGIDSELGWEESVNVMYQDVLVPAGFEVERLARVPYLCQGDVGSAFYELDDALFLLRVKDS